MNETLAGDDDMTQCASCEKEFQRDQYNLFCNDCGEALETDAGNEIDDVIRDMESNT